MNPQEATHPSSDIQDQRFDLLAADATEYALFLVDTDGRVLCWNRGAERLFGHRTDEAVGQHFCFLFTPEEVITGRPEHELRTARAEGHANGSSWHVRKDGVRFWARSSVTVLYDESKQVHAFARVTHDLTDGQAWEAEKRRADGLATANREKEEFVALLSHELRNPLSPILNALGILTRLRTNDPVIEQAGNIIQRQVKQMVRLVDDLLDISRIIKGKLRLETQPVDLRVVVSGAAETARPLMDARRHEFSLLLPTDPLWVEGDPGRLEQVAVNLLVNAAKYTDTGGLIRMTAAQQGDEAVVRVQDNGVGISPEKLSTVFDLFVQVDGSLSRSHGGLGIGLALVKTLVEMHGGRLSVTSGGVGKGSDFAFKLPALKHGVGSVTTTLERRAKSGNPLRVLIVEDNVDSGDSLSMLLRLDGHDVQLARSGPTGLEVAADFHPDLVLLDIGLPGMDGYEVCDRLRADPANAGVTICALSGYTPSDADPLRTNQAGFDHHFVKPLNLTMLSELMTSLG